MPEICVITNGEGIIRMEFLVKPSYEQVKLVIDEIVENYPYEKRLWAIGEIVFDFTTQELKNIAAYGK